MYYVQITLPLAGFLVRARMPTQYESVEAGLKMATLLNAGARESEVDLEYRLVDESGCEVKE